MPTNKELEARLDKLTGLVENLVNNLPPKEEKPAEDAPETPKTPQDDELWIQQELGGPSEPIPGEFRGVVDFSLNKNFGIHIKSQGGSMVFTILVPKRYSTMSQEQWNMMHFDKRPKVIPHSEGVDGVKSWADKVFSSFSGEYQALIVADRIANP